MRPPSRISRNWRKPAPRGPNRLPSGTAAPSKLSSRGSDARQPSLSSGCEIVEPGEPLGTTTSEFSSAPAVPEIVTAAGTSAARLVREARLAVELGRDGRDARFRELAHRAPQELVLLGQVEVHASEAASSAISRTPQPVPPGTRM